MIAPTLRPAAHPHSGATLSTSGRLLRRLDSLLLAAVGGLVAYGMWVVGVTRFDIPGDPDYYVMRQGISAELGVVGLAVVARSPPIYCRAAGDLQRAIALMVVVFAFAEAVRGSNRWIDLGRSGSRRPRSRSALRSLVRRLLADRGRAAGRPEDGR